MKKRKHLVTRRQFLTSASAFGSVLILPKNILAKGQSPNGRIRVAAIGTGQAGTIQVRNLIAQQERGLIHNSHRRFVRCGPQGSRQRHEAEDDEMGEEPELRPIPNTGRKWRSKSFRRRRISATTGKCMRPWRTRSTPCSSRPPTTVISIRPCGPSGSAKPFLRRNRCATSSPNAGRSPVRYSNDGRKRFLLFLESLIYAEDPTARGEVNRYLASLAQILQTAAESIKMNLDELKSAPL